MTVAVFKRQAQANRRSKDRARRPASSVDPRPAAQTIYEIPEPRFLLGFGVLAMLLLTVAAAPSFILSRAPGDLVNRRGGLGFVALAFAFVPLLIVIGSALSQ